MATDAPGAAPAAGSNGESEALADRGQPAVHDDPFASVLDLGSNSTNFRWVALVGTLLLHSVVVGIAATSLVELAEFARDIQGSVRVRLRTQYDFQVDRSRPKPRAPEPSKPEPPPPKAVRIAPNATPPPPVAEAPNLMALKPDPNAPVDLTADGIVVGNSDVIQSGWVASKGVAATASSIKPAASALPGGRGTAPVAQAEDLSRPPRLLTPELVNNCGFPPEADSEQIDFARVKLIVTVGADSSVNQVTVVSETPSGVGFGRRARTCSGSWRFDAARDAQGRPISQTVPVNVTFRRNQ